MVTPNIDITDLPLLQDGFEFHVMYEDNKTIHH